MQQTELYIYTIIMAALIFAMGYFYARKKMITDKSCALPKKPTRQQRNNIFILPGKKANDSLHPLGSVQSTIRGRIRFVGYGLMMLVVAGFALYLLYFTDSKMYFERNFINNLIGTMLFLGGIAWGLQLIYFSSCAITLRETGFELSSLISCKAYKYEEVDFYLHQIIEHKQHSDGYRPWSPFSRAGNFNYLWECQILFKDGREPIIVKSSRYAWLRKKMQRLIEALYGNGSA